MGFGHFVHHLTHKITHTVHHLIDEAEKHPLVTIGAAVAGYGLYSVLDATTTASASTATLGASTAKTATLGSAVKTAGSFAIHHPSLLVGTATLLSAASKPKIEIPDDNIPQSTLPKPPKMPANPEPFDETLGGILNGLFGLTKTNVHSGLFGSNVSFFSLLDDKGVTL